MEITKNMILAAHDYMTNVAKDSWVDRVAPNCFNRLSIKADEEQFPEMYMVNASLKSRYLLTALVSLYLGVKCDTEDEDALMMTEEEYDKWASSHVLCQIDRWKRDTDARDKCFDLLYDYHELEKRLSSQLTGLLNVQNDIVVRQSQQSATMMKQLPEMLQQLKELADKHQLDGKGDGDATTSPAE